MEKTPQTKICTKCKIKKDTKSFDIRNASKDCLTSMCKKCSHDNNKNYSRTRIGLIKKIYRSQRHSSLKRHHNPPTYSKDNFIDWMISRPNFEYLFTAWEQSGYKKEMIPSVDRLDDDKGYAFKNIQLVTWKINREKAYPIKGKLQEKSVNKFSKQGIFIKSYKSITLASLDTEATKCNISRVCKGSRKSAGGYIWAYS